MADRPISMDTEAKRVRTYFAFRKGLPHLAVIHIIPVTGSVHSS